MKLKKLKSLLTFIYKIKKYPLTPVWNGGWGIKRVLYKKCNLKLLPQRRRVHREQ